MKVAATVATALSEALIPMWWPLYCDQCRKHVRWVLQRSPILVEAAPRLQLLCYVLALLALLAPTANTIQLCTKTLNAANDTQRNLHLYQFATDACTTKLHQPLHQYYALVTINMVLTF